MSADPDFEHYADQKVFNSSVPPTWQAGFDAALKLVGKDTSEVRFLDIGCGDGKLFAPLQQMGLAAENVHGVEVSHKRVQRCQDIGWANARFMKPGSALPYANASFDVINLLEVVEHVPANTIESLLGEVRRVLAPKGQVLLTTPNYPIKRFYDFYNAIAHGKWERFKDDPTHVTFYNHARLSALLLNGFSSVIEHKFKDGFLYSRLPLPFLRHKIFYICSEPR